MAPEESPLKTRDAQRQFFLVEDDEELQRVLSAPWAEWAVFLHPLQRHAAYSNQRGPTVITGGAGTGKTVVALHRARYLARKGMRVLLTTFSSTLAADLLVKRDLLLVSRGRARNLFSGPEPEMRAFQNVSEENAWVARRISELVEEGYEPDMIGVFARLNARLKGIELFLKRRNIKSMRLKKSEYPAEEGCVKLGTMHRAKGLEFRVVFLVSVNEDALPESSAVGDPDDALERRTALQRERQLLYVNVTRARERLFVCHHGPPSIFLVKAGLLLEEERV